MIKRFMQHGGRFGSSRGASAVEFAIIAPLFFMITFGTFTGALAFNQKNELTHAAREGARYGATLPTGDFATGADWANAIVNATVDAGYGNLGASIPGRRICVALVENDDDLVTGFFADTGSATSSTCFDDGGADGSRRVHVRVWRDGFINAVLFRMNLTLQSEASSRLEGGATST